MIETQLAGARWGRGRWLAVGLLLASGAGGAPALAQGTRGPAVGVKCASGQATPRASSAVDADKEVAKRYEAEGVKALNAEQWEKARTALREAFKRERHCQIAANLGWAELMAGKPRDAAEHLSFFLREAQDVSDADRQEAETMLVGAKAAIGTVTVRVDAVGAEVLVDGQEVGTSPLAEPVFVEPGSRTFEARMAGLSLERQVIKVVAGAAPVVELKLAPMVIPVATQAQAPVSSVEAPPETAGPRWRTWPFMGSVGLAAAGIGLGVGLTVVANETGQAADDKLKALKLNTPTQYQVCGKDHFRPNGVACEGLKETLHAQDRLTNAAVAGYVVGGVAAVGAVTFLLWPRPRFPRAGVQVVPALGSGHGGMVVLGSF